MEKSTFKRARILQLFLLNGAVLLAAATYSLAYLICYRRGISLFSCKFASRFHVYCPGCGGSRSVISLLHFDVLSSLRYYPPIPLAVLLLLDFDVRLILDAVRGNDRAVRAFRPKSLLAVPIAILLVFAVRLVLVLGFSVDPLGDLAASGLL